VGHGQSSSASGLIRAAPARKQVPFMRYTCAGRASDEELLNYNVNI
jgi:hypothetical protein